MTVEQIGGLAYTLHDYEADEPLPLPPRGKVTRTFRPEDAGMSLDAPFGAFVALASGSGISVEPQQLPAMLVSQVQTNRPTR